MKPGRNGRTIQHFLILSKRICNADTCIFLHFLKQCLQLFIFRRNLRHFVTVCFLQIDIILKTLYRCPDHIQCLFLLQFISLRFRNDGESAALYIITDIRICRSRCKRTVKSFQSVDCLFQHRFVVGNHLFQFMRRTRFQKPQPHILFPHNRFQRLHGRVSKPDGGSLNIFIQRTAIALPLCNLQHIVLHLTA